MLNGLSKHCQWVWSQLRDFLWSWRLKWSLKDIRYVFQRAVWLCYTSEWFRNLKDSGLHQRLSSRLEMNPSDRNKDSRQVLRPHISEIHSNSLLDWNELCTVDTCSLLLFSVCICMLVKKMLSFVFWYVTGVHLSFEQLFSQVCLSQRCNKPPSTSIQKNKIPQFKWNCV